MTATSVTGRGLGSADGSNKGSVHMTLGAEKLIGPRVVAADSLTLDGSGDGSVELPVLDGSSADYVVIATDADTTAAGAVAAKIVITASASTLTFKGPASSPVAYTVIKKGLAI